MPNRNRGPQPQDQKLFAPKFHAALTAATDDLCWLLGRGYGIDSALQLVGNRYRLNKRQRTAVGRVSAAPEAVRLRQTKRVALAEIAGRTVAIDGFNLLILLESALGGGLILEARDGTFRDLASVHGTYKRVKQTDDILRRVGEALRPAAAVVWYFDQPVSNSGRLKTRIRELGEEYGFDWSAELDYNPDKLLISLPDDTVLVSSDSWILDDGGAWCNLGRELLAETKGVWVLRI